MIKEMKKLFGGQMKEATQKSMETTIITFQSRTRWLVWDPVLDSKRSICHLKPSKQERSGRFFGKKNCFANYPETSNKKNKQNKQCRCLLLDQLITPRPTEHQRSPLRSGGGHSEDAGEDRDNGGEEEEIYHRYISSSSSWPA